MVAIPPPKQFPCQDGEPLLKLETGAQAPVLNYSLPQDTSFTTYGQINMNLPISYFNAAAGDITGAPTITRTNPDGTVTTTTVFKPSDFVIPYSGLYNMQAWGGLSIFGTPSVLPTLQAKVSTSLLSRSQLSRQVAANLSTFFASSSEGLANLANLVDLPTQAVSWESVLTEYLEGYDPEEIADKVNRGFMVHIIDKYGGYGKRVVFMYRPTLDAVKPELYFVEEYVCISFARDYGAGKTLQTHSLFPGEKTTITIKTFKEMKTIQSRAENVIDSFSKESAEEFEQILERETSKQVQKVRGGNASNSTTVGLNFSVPKIGTGSMSNTNSKNFNASNTRTTNARNLSKATSKSVNKSNSSREININTSTQQTQTESEEIATVRQFENINRSRVLNLAFRELVQEYVTIIYLNDVKIGFTNGDIAKDLIYSLENLDELLELYINPDAHQDVKDRILFEYQTMPQETPYDTIKTFGDGLVKKVRKTNYEGDEINYLCKDKNLKHIYKVKESDKRDYEVPGVILDVKNYTMRTPAVVVDAFLGHGEALDCYAMAMQNEAVRKAQQENTQKEAELAMEQAKMTLIQTTLNAITDPIKRAEWLAKLLNPPAKETEIIERNTVNNIPRT